jgi:DNA invertase Pin-like site-specific DNA recombinase
MDKAVGLIRVSTEGQAQDGCSLALQKEKIHAYASLNDFELVDIIVEAGISGRAKKREGLEQAMEMVEKGAVQHFIVYKLDRMSRSLKQAIELSDLLHKKGVTLHSVTEKIDTSSPQGKLFFNLMNALSSFEADVISWRTKEALQSKKGRGERVGQVPYGLTLSEDGVSLVEDQAEQRIIKSIVRYHKQGIANYAIACRLNERQIPTKNQGLWRNHTVKGILDRAL